MKIIRLTATEFDLSGSYSHSDEDIFVELDSSISAFSVTLPDLKSCGNHIFRFKNFGANSVTLNTSHGQIIDFAGITSKVLVYKEYFALASNGIDKWFNLEFDKILDVVSAILAGTEGYLVRHNSSGTTGNSAIYDNGNIGIGTTAPNSKLQVNGIVNVGDQGLNAYSTFQVMKSNSNAIYILLGNVATGGYNWVYGATAQGNGAVGGGKFVFYVLNSAVLGEKLIYYIDGDTGLVKYLYGVEIAGDLKVTSKFGCNGATPQAAYALGNACTDLATVIALANLMRTALINNGIGKVS